MRSVLNLTVLVFSFLALLLVGCQKEELSNEPYEPPKDPYFYVWETPPSGSNPVKVPFTLDSAYALNENVGALYASGFFRGQPAQVGVFFLRDTTRTYSYAQQDYAFYLKLDNILHIYSDYHLLRVDRNDGKWIEGTFEGVQRRIYNSSRRYHLEGEFSVPAKRFDPREF